MLFVGNHLITSDYKPRKEILGRGAELISEKESEPVMAQQNVSTRAQGARITQSEHPAETG
jgi:hypothetical protein